MDTGFGPDSTPTVAEVDLFKVSLRRRGKDEHIRALTNMGLDLTTLEGQLKFALIDQRTKELVDRYSSPQIRAGYKAFLVSVLGRDEPALATLFENNEVISILLEGVARQSAIGEYRTVSEAKSGFAKALRENEEHIALGGEEFVEAQNTLENMVQDWLRDNPIFEFNSRVFDGLLKLAETEGFNAALVPEARKSVIQKMVPREQYIKMREASLKVGMEMIGGLGALDPTFNLMVHAGDETLVNLARQDIYLDAESIYS